MGLDIIFDSSEQTSEPSGPPEIDIVAVHGLNIGDKPNHASATWTSKENGCLWLKDLLPSRLPNPARVMLFGYNASPAVGAGAVNLKDYAEKLLISLTIKRAEKPTRPIVFICHSMGGLVVKQALIEAKLNVDYKYIAESTRLLVFFSTPHRGGNYATVGEFVVALFRTASNGPKNDLITLLKRESQGATNLHEMSRHMAGNKLLMISFYEENTTKLFGRQVKRIVDKSSATLNLPGNIETQVPIAADHSTICKFSSYQDRDCELVISTIARQLMQSLEMQCDNTIRRRPSTDLKIVYMPLPTSTGDTIDQAAPTNMSDGRSIYSVLLKSLSFPREDARLRTIRAPHKETCQWVFEQAEFKDWRDTSKIKDHHGFLWIKGKPGSGKSTMWKTVYNRVRQQHRSGVITYCFNARAANPLERSTHGMYRSLVHQLLRALPQFQDSFVEEFSTKAKLLSSSKGDPANAKWEVDEWTIPELQVFLTDVIRSLGAQPLSIFIDALDEGEEADVRPMVWFLEELGHVAISSNSLFHVCLSSRHYPNITIKKGVSLTLDHHQGHSDDIATFVHDRLNGGERPEMENLRHDICHRASGVFLWVILAVQILNELHDQGEVDAMSQRLSELPGELNDVFKELLLRDTVDLERTILLLQWVLFAKEPLSPAQLYSAIKTGSQSQDEFDFTIPNEKVIERYILRCSKGLIEISKTWSSNAVQFIHETARDFLLKDGLVILNPNLSSSLSGLSHDQLKNGCFRYFLKLENRRSSYNGKKPSQLRKLNEEFPLLSYAVHRMFHHADDAQRDGISQNDFLREFGVENKGKLEKCVDYRSKLDEESKETGREYPRFRKYRSENDKWLLYSMTGEGRIHLVKALTNDSDLNAEGSKQSRKVTKRRSTVHRKSNHSPPNNSDELSSYSNIPPSHPDDPTPYRPSNEEYKSAFRLAVDESDEEIVNILIETAAVAEDNTGNVDALHAAAQRGRYGIVKKLLEKGVDVKAISNRRKYGGTNALQEASYAGHVDIVELLLEKGADVNAEVGEYGNALQAASYEGHVKVIELLLEKGANISAEGGKYGNALQAASFTGKAEAVELLVKKGANIHAKGGFYGNALQAASHRGHKGIIELLLREGADVNAGSGRYHGALGAAADEEITELLLANGADITANGGTCLVHAAQTGTPAFKLLLEKGVDVNAQWKNLWFPPGPTSLHNAAEYPHMDSHELMLIKNRMRDLEETELLREPLSEAEKSAWYRRLEEEEEQKQYCESEIKRALERVELLLVYKADVNLRGGRLGYPLQAASFGGSHEIVKVLLDNGAEVNMKGGRFGSALIAAASEGFDTTVELLLENGADVNGSGKSFGTALLAASAARLKYGDKRPYGRIIDLLLDKGAFVDARVPPSRFGRFSTALQAAAMGLFDETVELLIKKGADVNAQCPKCGTALIAACGGNSSWDVKVERKGKLKVIQLLVHYGADVNAQIRGFLLPISEAYSYSGADEREAIIDLLLEHGADPLAERRPRYNVVFLLRWTRNNKKRAARRKAYNDLGKGARRVAAMKILSERDC